jgi:hypothetical protein
MNKDERDNRNSMIAAALILVIIGAGIYFMPKIVLAIGSFSPVLGFAAGFAIILSFFLILWLRSRFKK